MKFYLSFLHLLYPVIIMAQSVPIESANDIIGCYEKIHLSVDTQKQLNDIEPWPMPYEWFCFEPNGTLYTMGSNQYEKQSSDSLHEIFRVIPPDISYAVIESGIIKTEQTSANQTIIWGGHFIDKTITLDHIIFEKGSFLMTIFSPEKQKYIYYRFLKKLD